MHTRTLDKLTPTNCIELRSALPASIFLLYQDVSSAVPDFCEISSTSFSNAPSRETTRRLQRVLPDTLNMHPPSRLTLNRHKIPVQTLTPLTPRKINNYIARAPPVRLATTAKKLQRLERLRPPTSKREYQETEKNRASPRLLSKKHIQCPLSHTALT